MRYLPLLEALPDVPNSNILLIIYRQDLGPYGSCFAHHLIAAMDTSGLGDLLGSVSFLHIVLFVTAAYLVAVRLWEYNRLSHIKGPPTTGISWWWHSKAVLSGQAQRYYGDVTEKYGTTESLNSPRQR